MFPDLDFRRTVLWPIHLCLCPRRCRLNWAAGFGFQNFRVEFFFSDSLTTLEDQPVCHIYQWAAHPTYGSVGNHWVRMMDGFTMDDLTSGSGTGSLPEDDVVLYVRGGDATNQDCDDWLLRMTFRINSFLRANLDNP